HSADIELILCAACECHPTVLRASEAYSDAHAFIRQFLLGFFVLGQVHQSHASQHISCLGELNIVVANDLYSVAPRVPEIEELTVKWRHTSCLKGLSGCLFIIDDQAEVSTVIWGLSAALLKGNKLVAQVDESHRVTLAAQFETEESTIERQRFVNITDLNRNVVHANHARFSELSHLNLLGGSED